METDNSSIKVMGIFTVSGSIGIIIATSAGGFFFDIWRSAGPFIFCSVLNEN